MRIHEVRNIPINIISIPLKERWNPVVVLYSKYKIIVRGEINYDYSCMKSLNGSIPRSLARNLRSFLDSLSNELSIDFCYRVAVEVDDEIRNLRSSIYVVVSQILFESLLSKLQEKMDPVDIVKSLSVIDNSINTKSQHIEALRLAYAINRGVIFRRIDEYIELEDPPRILKLKIKRIYRLKEHQNPLVEGDLGDLLTKLVGYMIIDLSRDLLDRRYNIFFEKMNYVNRLWSLIYGLPLTNKHYLYDEWNRVILADILFSNLDL